MGASYCARVMDQTDNLIIYKGRDRPTKEEMKSLTVHGNFRKELSSFRKDLALNDGQEILLALSVATNEMIRSVQMHPEIQFMDTAANLNKQKRSTYFSIVKHSNGQCFIGNITVLPCEQQWIFYKIHELFVSSCTGRRPFHELD